MKDFNGYPAFCEIDNLTGEAVVEFTNGTTFTFPKFRANESKEKIKKAKDFICNLSPGKLPDIETRKDPIKLYEFIARDFREKLSINPEVAEGILLMGQDDLNKFREILKERYLSHPQYQVIVGNNGNTRRLKDKEVEKLWSSLNQKTTTP